VSNQEKHIFTADRPILKASEDLLNRAKFSRELAVSISKWTEKESLVVAIYGRWGDGKTSVKNMVKEIFENEKTPMFMEFSPWQWANENHITEAFFKELANKLGASKNDDQREVAKKLLDYAEYLELGNELIGKFKNILEKLLLLAIGGTGIISTIVSAEYKVRLIITSLILFVITLALEEIIWGFKWIARWKNIHFEHQKTLEERKAELINALSKVKSTMVVFIDDIDRLSKSEIKTLFRLIKANADFPNIVYLTLFQRDIVERSLEKDEVFAGTDYLKKIVQIGFNLPKLQAGEIHKILFKELERLLDESGLNPKFEQSRWNELFIGGLSNYFENLRDVNRFIATFSFHLGVFKSDTSYEINFIDLIGLEVLRQFEPQVYEIIFYSKKLLTESSGSSHRGSEQSRKKEMEELLEQASIEHKEGVKIIIKVLFPNSQWAWGSNYIYSVGDDEFIKLRINHKDYFDRYFSLYLPVDDIKQSEFEYVLSVTSEEHALFDALMKFHDQDRLPQFVKKFEAYKQVVDKKDAVPFISVMLKLGDILSDEYEGFFSISPVTHIKRIILWYFNKNDFTPEERQDLYWKILESSTAIFLPIAKLWDEADRRNLDKYPDHYFLKNIDTKKILELLGKKIDQNKDRYEFKSSRHLPKILFIWNQVDKAASKIWLEKYINEDANLISFLMKLENITTTTSGYETFVNYFIQLNWLKEFFDDIPSLAKRVRQIKSTTITKDEKTKRLFGNIDRVEDQFLHPEKYPDLMRKG